MNLLETYLTRNSLDPDEYLRAVKDALTTFDRRVPIYLIVLREAIISNRKGICNLYEYNAYPIEIIAKCIDIDTKNNPRMFIGRSKDDDEYLSAMLMHVDLENVFQYRALITESHEELFFLLTLMGFIHVPWFLWHFPDLDNYVKVINKFLDEIFIPEYQLMASEQKLTRSATNAVAMMVDVLRRFSSVEGKRVPEKFLDKIEETHLLYRNLPNQWVAPGSSKVFREKLGSSRDELIEDYLRVLKESLKTFQSEPRTREDVLHLTELLPHLRNGGKDYRDFYAGVIERRFYYLKKISDKDYPGG